MTSISIDLASLNKSHSFHTKVWGHSVTSYDCGEEVARWLSRFLMKEDIGYRLAYYPYKKPVRPKRNKKNTFPLTLDSDLVG